MKVERLADAEAFLARAGGWLAEREALHNLTLGVVHRYAASPGVYGDVVPYFGVAVEGGRIVACVSRTAAVGAILSEVDADGAAEALAGDVHDALPGLAGVVGPSAGTKRFAATWAELSGAAPRVALEQLIYEAESVVVPDVPGRARAYRRDDRELVVDWLAAFAGEVLLPERVDPEEFLDRRLADPDTTVLLWEDGDEPVSLAMSGSPTPKGIRVGPVYTPPPRRRRGYAAAVTAEVTRRALEGGRRYCFLYTDAANPTSNSVYRGIGYRLVGDATQWRF
ncbi:MAG TPA: GNAT family N-acetyltransferase [Gaiellaceae bacterium]|nr:GNAT family N-acetyltransferase [Gaiellaceae bacterium]